MRFVLLCLAVAASGTDVRGVRAQDSIPPPPADSSGPAFTLTGRILDALSGDPVIAAVIKVPELKRYAQSNLQGRFHFADFPPGTWNIVVEQLGYRTSQGSVTVSDGNGLDVRLAPDPVALEGRSGRTPSSCSHAAA